jgi:hypothetical protein
MTTIHFKARPGDWLMSGKILRAAVAAIEASVKVDRSYDIPYLAGYSKDGNTIYLDRHMDSSATKQKILIEPFIILHEVVEKALERYIEPYQLRHQIALHIERDAVESAMINWADYNEECMRQVKRAGDERLTRCPKDLDLTPMEDEKDFATLKRIVEAGGN